MCTMKWKKKINLDKNKFQNILFSDILLNDSSYINIFLDQKFKLKNKKSVN